jgi:guanosine-3',5'-bis(diphosphate) 3'-pyrophosphohydrolase
MELRELLSIVKKNMPGANAKKIEEAYRFSSMVHANQTRASGEPYIGHPTEVAAILAEMKLDEATIITALLHDTVEDTVATLEQISDLFGEEIAKLVDGVTKLAKIKYQTENLRQAENFRKLLLAMSEDIRVLLVKLADRLHNMRTIEFVKDDKKKRIAIETMEIYAPLAERIGIQKIKNEIQDRAFAILHPEERQSILNRLEFLKKDDGHVVDKIESHIKQTISDMGIEAQVIGREKNPCSIWQKMKQKNISFEQLSDIIAFRVIVNDVIDCYMVLGIIHAAYHMVPGSFKDYISTPKDNGYSSLHTVVVGPEKQRIEVQIRTYEMNEVNELGVAAHWAYKQNMQIPVDGRQYRWIRELLSILENSSSEEFLEHTKLEMYEDQVFCFTPQGYIVALPKGATPVDFAYALHSDIGNSCIGAKINGRITPLRSKLENGDQVEIIRSDTQTPSISWEKFVITGKAKAEIRRFLRHKQKSEYINLGKSILIKYFKDLEQEFDYTQTNDLIKPHLKDFHKKSLDDFYQAVGDGNITIREIDKILTTIVPKQNNDLFTRLFAKLKKKHKSESYSVPIKGLIPGMAMNYASCCHPLPGDKIIGIQNPGKGITVHTSDCDMLENFNDVPERWIDLAWDICGKNDIHVGRVKAILLHQPGSLATVTTIIASNGANINNMKVISRSNDFFEVMLDLEVHGVNQLNNIIASLRSKTCVHSVDRFKE